MTERLAKLKQTMIILRKVSKPIESLYLQDRIIRNHERIT